MWHEARRSEKKVHDMMDAARKRAQRRAIFLAKRRGDPQQSIQAVGSRCRVYRDDGLYQVAQDQQSLIPWTGKDDILIDRFDGRALLDFIREPGFRRHRAQQKSEEEEELEEFVNFERYRDLIKHRRRGFTDEEGLQHVALEMGAKIIAPFAVDRSQPQNSSTGKGSYSQVGFSYDGDGKGDANLSDDDEEGENDDDDEDVNSDDSGDEQMDVLAREFGVKRYGYLVYMDKKAKDEEKRQKEVIKGDPSIKKLSRKERRKISQMERDKEREAVQMTGTQRLHHDPYREPRRSPTYEAYPHYRRSRSRSRSRSPSYSRHRPRGGHSNDVHHGKPRTPKVEYITEFGGAGDVNEPKFEGYSPPSSPLYQADELNRQLSGHILDALHVDPASGVSLDKEKNTKVVKPPASTSSALSKLNKPGTSVGPSKLQQGEKKETPQERLKRIMSKQLNKQIKKDTATEMAKKREQERQRLEKIAETNRLSCYKRRSRSRSYSRSPGRRSRSRSYSHSPPRRYRHSTSRSRSRSSRRYYSRSRSQSRSRSPSQRRSHSRTSSRSKYSRSPGRSRRRY